MKAKKIISLGLAAALSLSLLVGMNIVSAQAETTINIPRFSSAPTIDGNIDPAEWGEKLMTVENGAADIRVLEQTAGQAVPPLTADVYIGYDDTHVYFAAKAVYENHKNPALLGVDIWQGSCLQIQISAEPGTARNELGFGLGTSPKRQMAHAWASTVNEFNMAADQDYVVTRNDDTQETIYEIALPLDQFSSKVTSLDSIDAIALSFAFTMADQGGFYEYLDGIVQVKDITLAATGVLEKGAGGGSASDGGTTAEAPASAGGGSALLEDGTIDLVKFANAPAIDGVVNEAEWGTKAMTVAAGQPEIRVIEKGGKPTPDFTADVFLGYDDTHVYIAAVADYEKHENPALLGADIWQGDCLQVQISAEPGTARNELGFGLGTSPKRQMSHAWATTVNEYKMEGDKDFVVTRDDDAKRTVYEIALPISMFTSTVSSLDSIGDIALSLAFTLSGESGFYEFKDGIVENKDITMAATAHLTGAALANEPSSEVTTAPEPTPEPTETPTEAPTEAPTETPTEAPTEAATEAPTEAATQAPTQTTTPAPTQTPSNNDDDGPNVGLIVGIIVAVVAVGGIGGYFVMKGKKKQ